MKISKTRALVAVCAVSALLSGCTVVGPAAINRGRLTYNEAIARTDSQQMLMAVVRNRYVQNTSMLAVSSVTANVRVSATTGIQVGVGDSENYDGNLVPLSARAVYEDNPTISYVPVSGPQYLRQFASPVSVDLIAQLTGTVLDARPVLRTLVSGMNGIYNPDFLYPGEVPDPRFDRVTAILATLNRTHRMHWVEDPNSGGEFSIVIDHYAPEFAAEVGELLVLLGLNPPEEHSRPVILPVSLAIDGRESGGVGLTTRSVMRLAEVLSAAVEIPAADLEGSVTIDYPPLGPGVRDLRIRSAKKRPADAAVAVQYRNSWFYIDDGDLLTKQYFRLAGVLWSTSMAEGTAGRSAAPVLTVPVTR